MERPLCGGEFGVATGLLLAARSLPAGCHRRKRGQLIFRNVLKFVDEYRQRRSSDRARLRRRATSKSVRSMSRSPLSARAQLRLDLPGLLDVAKFQLHRADETRERMHGSFAGSTSRSRTIQFQQRSTHRWR